MIKKIGALGFVLLLLVTSVFSQEKVEDYLNKILDLHEKTVKEIVKNLPEDKRDWYNPLYRDYQVVLEHSKLVNVYVDVTYIESQKYIHISTGVLWSEDEINGKQIKWETKSEAEIAGLLAHGLAHLISAPDQKIMPNSDEEYIESEIVADTIAIMILLKEGYQCMAYMNWLERCIKERYDLFEQIRSKEVFHERVQSAKRMATRILLGLPFDKRKKFIIATQEEFEEIKELLKSGE